MKIRPVSEKKIERCFKCGDFVVKRTTKAGKEFYATVYQEEYYLGVVVKNDFEIEHRHI
jgi:hypothetical protein